MVVLKLFPKRESVQYEIIQSFYYSGVGGGIATKKILVYPQYPEEN